MRASGMSSGGLGPGGEDRVTQDAGLVEQRGAQGVAHAALAAGAGLGLVVDRVVDPPAVAALPQVVIGILRVDADGEGLFHGA
jgi:hypothetical protein